LLLLGLRFFNILNPNFTRVLLNYVENMIGWDMIGGIDLLFTKNFKIIIFNQTQ
jgi:hypothetical protein